MNKKLIGLMTGVLCLVGLTGCKKAVEKEYEMTIVEAPISAVLKNDNTQSVVLAHCKRGMSLYNYYIELPEITEDFVMPEHLVAKATDKKTSYIVSKGETKSDKVSDHGYIFIK